MSEREELHAALEARKELGPDYEPQVVDSFLERIEKRLDEHRRMPAEPHRSVTPMALGSIGAGVGATAIAVGNGQGWVAVVAWIAIAIVNLGYAFRRR
jgi:hypothetical protein